MSASITSVLSSWPLTCDSQIVQQGRASFLAFRPEVNIPNITAHILRTLRAFKRKIIQMILGFWLSEGTKRQLH